VESASIPLCSDRVPTVEGCPSAVGTPPLHQRTAGAFWKSLTRTDLTAEKMEQCRWVKPKLVSQIAFAEWTDAGHLRHCTFIGMRDDKKPSEVVREIESRARPGVLDSSRHRGSICNQDPRSRSKRHCQTRSRELPILTRIPAGSAFAQPEAVLVKRCRPTCVVRGSCTWAWGEGIGTVSVLHVCSGAQLVSASCLGSGALWPRRIMAHGSNASFELRLRSEARGLCWTGAPCHCRDSQLGSRVANDRRLEAQLSCHERPGTVARGHSPTSCWRPPTQPRASAVSSPAPRRRRC
jgi:ATP dependent DNA ligase C terminal region